MTSSPPPAVASSTAGGGAGPHPGKDTPAMDSVFVRAAHPCSDSLGHRWPTAGAVISMPRTEAAALFAIPDAGFSEVTAPDGPLEPAPVVGVAEPAPAAAAVTEPAPPAIVTEPAPAPVKRRPGRPRKTPAPAVVAPLSVAPAALEGHPS